ncbi:MAG: adhP [Sphingomonadales bacterium]|nr:adhP [Sphingomonadales bacterium]
MKAWVLTDYNRPLTHVTLPTPEVSGTQVRVSVEFCGLCHSDLHTWQGVTDLGSRGVVHRPKGEPIAIGHEIVGRVVAFGPDAVGVEIGDRRIVYPWLGCGCCAMCEAGQDNLCAIASHSLGFSTNGGFASEVVLPHPRYLLDPGNLDPALAATYACSGLTVLSAIRKILPLGPNEPVVTIGAGGLGLQAIAMLRALGHENIIAADVSSAKKDLVLGEGAAQFVEIGLVGAAASIVEAVGAKVAAVLDFVNSTTTALAAFDMLRKGGTMVQVGLYGGELIAPLPMLTLQILSIRGSLTGTIQDLRDVIDLAQSGKLKPVPIERVDMDDANKAIARLAAGDVKGRLVLQRMIEVPARS